MGRSARPSPRTIPFVGKLNASVTPMMVRADVPYIFVWGTRTTQCVCTCPHKLQGFDDGPTPPGLTPTKKPTKAPTGTPPVSEDDDDAPTGSGTDDEAPSGSGSDEASISGSGDKDGSPGPNPPAIAPPISPPTSPPTSRSPKAGKGKTKTAKTFKANAGTRTNPFD